MIENIFIDTSVYEEWHFRYFGLELAKELYDKKLIYEEYLAMK